MDLVRQRLRTQRLMGAPFATPVEAVRFFGAVQAQDYQGALWAVGLRTGGATERLVEQAVIDRDIVRSWPLRGTLHFVAADDLRWILKATAARTITSAASRFTNLELDAPALSRSRRVVEKALASGRTRTRTAIYQRLEAARIATDNGRGLHILWRLAHDGLICFGAREGKQHTFALLDEWLPRSRSIDRDEALAELAHRYFVSHGPATLHDFAWWSGLSAADAMSALESTKRRLVSERSGAIEYWWAESDRGKAATRARSPQAWLLPAYDEYTVAYRDRRSVMAAKHAARSANGLKPAIVIDGQVMGTWSCVRARSVVGPQPFVRLNPSQREALDRAVGRFRAFSAAR